MDGGSCRRTSPVRPSVSWARAAALPFAAALASCSLPPLRGRAEIGRDAYAIFVADTPDGSDLFAILPTGGAPIPLTFTVVDERAPALAPDGGTVAFLREQHTGDSVRTTVWLMNLLSGSEREVTLPDSLRATPRAVAWTPDGRAVYVRTDRGVVRSSAPPVRGGAHLVSAVEASAADSAFYVLLGQPAFGRAAACDAGVCLIGTDGESTGLAAGARDPLRWGRDSVAYFRGDQVEIRPLGPGRAHLLGWEPAPLRPREMTFFEGRRPTDER